MNGRSLVRLGSLIVQCGCRRHGIEKSEAEQSGDKASDMRLPGDCLREAGAAERNESEQYVAAEPDQQKCDDARIAQAHRERRRRHAVGLLAVAPEAERTATLYCKPRRPPRSTLLPCPAPVGRGA